jgi:hypothetical protein
MMDRAGRGAWVDMKRSLPLLTVLVAGACLPLTKSVGEATETEGSTGSDGGPSTGSPNDVTTDATSSEPPSSSESTTSTTGNPSDVTTDDTSATGEPPSFACPPEPDEQQCDPVVQDCPSGFHCVPWSSAGNLEYDAFVCAPLAGDPAGRHDACTPDPASCGDDCDVGSYCFPEFDSGQGGICLGTCSSDGLDETCQAGEVCVTCATCSVGTCWPSCDPLDPQCPEESSTCTLTQPDGFVCYPVPLGEASLGEECEYNNSCIEGLVCVDGSVLGDACQGLGCCTELCDIIDGDPACSDPGHVCISFYLPGLAPDGFDHLGVCGVPEADPCAVPGTCPPPGIDDTYSWCSDGNSDYCPEGSLAGYGNGITCESGCVCHTSCVDAVDCPVPPTGTAVPECLDEPFGPGSPTSCLLTCDAGETCPDGLTCSEDLTTESGEALCIWVSPLPPEQC